MDNRTKLSKTKNREFLTILLVLLGLAIITGGYFLYQMDYKQSPVPATTQSKTASNNSSTPSNPSTSSTDSGNSNSEINQDIKNIDSNISTLNDEAKGVDSGLNDSQTDLN